MPDLPTLLALSVAFTAGAALLYRWRTTTRRHLRVPSEQAEQAHALLRQAMERATFMPKELLDAPSFEDDRSFMKHITEQRTNHTWVHKPSSVEDDAIDFVYFIESVDMPEPSGIEPPTDAEASTVAPTSAKSVDHALAMLFIQLGPPPEPTETDYAPASNGGGGAQQ